MSLSYRNQVVIINRHNLHEKAKCIKISHGKGSYPYPQTLSGTACVVVVVEMVVALERLVEVMMKRSDGKRAAKWRRNQKLLL